MFARAYIHLNITIAAVTSHILSGGLSQVELFVQEEGHHERTCLAAALLLAWNELFFT